MALTGTLFRIEALGGEMALLLGVDGQVTGLALQCAGQLQLAQR
ncbi:MAG TPA: hypothetical protein PKE45_06115 [Caldilineaceae bacterium]|nr:hypothetical protein [Caldilineaceae bacterium]